MKDVLGGLAAPLGVATVALVGLIVPSAAPSPRHPSSAAYAVPRPEAPADGGDPGLARAEALDGLGVGDGVVGWTVLRIEAPELDALDVTLTRQERTFVVTVQPVDRATHVAPRVAADRAIFYGHVLPDGASLDPVERDAVLDEFARRLEASERARAPVPE